MRVLFPLVFLLLFAGWIGYHLLVKKDLRQQRNNLLAGCAFAAVWALIYFCWIK